MTSFPTQGFGSGGGGASGSMLDVFQSKPGYQFGSVYPRSESQVDGHGILENITVQDTTSTAVWTADGAKFSQSGIAAATSLTVIFQQPTSASITGLLAANPVCEFKFSLDEFTAQRFAVGLCDTNSTNYFTNSDTPTDLFVGLSAFTTPDTNFQFTTYDGVTMTKFDTGVPVDTAIHYLRVEVDSASSMTVTLYDSDHVAEATNTFTADLPAVGGHLTPTLANRTSENVVKTANFYSLTLVARNEVP